MTSYVVTMATDSRQTCVKMCLRNIHTAHMEHGTLDQIAYWLTHCLQFIRILLLTN